jgi:hypothetical protein
MRATNYSQINCKNKKNEKIDDFNNVTVYQYKKENRIFDKNNSVEKPSI